MDEHTTRGAYVEKARREPPAHPFYLGTKIVKMTTNRWPAPKGQPQPPHNSSHKFKIHQQTWEKTHLKPKLWHLVHEVDPRHAKFPIEIPPFKQMEKLRSWIFDFCDYREFSRISHWILRVMRNYSHMELRYALAFILFVGNPQVHLRVQYEQIIYSSNKLVFSHQVHVALEVLQEFQQQDYLLQLLRVLWCCRRPLERNESIFYMMEFVHGPSLVISVHYSGETK